MAEFSKTIVCKQLLMALRMMKYADHHGFPIVTFVDTPRAFADLKSEELGQVCFQLLFSLCKLYCLIYFNNKIGLFLCRVNQ